MAKQNKITAEDSGTKVIDTIKLSIALLMLLSSIGAFYYFEEFSQLYRILALLSVVALSVFLVINTKIGNRLYRFSQDARIEVLKVVWPSRAQATQTTLVVLIVVTLIGIFLWLLDMFLAWAYKFLINIS
ncbi:MAG: preprotein translocase subunit SecE [Gammaproteobacteria bacterium]|nr:MAG: preprotein translocase subunit SecE [Gammaproteobacteria bacterium]